MNRVPPLRAFFGHHKCATQWIRAIVEDVCALTGLRPVPLSLLEENPWVSSLPEYVARTRPDVLLYMNADIAQVRTLASLRGFHVVRDPRDLVVSAYYSHLHSHPLDTWPGLAEHRRRLESVGKTEGLLLEMDFSRRVLDEIRAWDYAQPDVLEMRMEDLVRSPYERMAEIMIFLGLVRPPARRLDLGEQGAALAAAAASRLQRSAGDVLYATLRAADATTRRLLGRKAQRWRALPGREHLASVAPLDRLRFRRRRLDLASLLGIVHRHRFPALSGGRDRGVEDARSHYRKGSAGDWSNHFEPVHVERFKHSYNDLLLTLGYETTPDWDRPATR